MLLPIHFLSCTVSLIISFASSTSATPAKRSYDSHHYYVLEIDPSQSKSPQEIANALGAEHVEQVGELQHHYLIRAEKKLLGDLNKRVTTDLVLENYDRLKSIGKGELSKRSIGLSIVSLDKQILKKRVKREFTSLPPVIYGSGFTKRTYSARSSISPRQIPETVTPVPALITEMVNRFNILDPLFPKQWHLVNGIMPENSVNVTGVWEQGVYGKGVNVAIVDDGLDMHSDDLAPNFHAEGSWDYNDNTALPEPRLSDDQHGTRCAGEIAAANNDVCGVGVAYEAGIAGIRILSASISDADEAAALNYGYQTNSIYSCSWGPPDDGRSMEAPGRLIVKAMLNGIQKGRQGKGSIFVFASGNGGAVDDQCNFDGYTNSLMSITVGALDRKGLHPFYSEACSANMVVTYSSGSGDNIHTTDVGKNLCTDRHGGTSAAAPIAAGVFALVLEVRPDLTWRDMQHLCVQTAVQINPTDPDWQMTASGRNFNHKYGYGKLDAWAMVNAARSYKLVKPQAWWSSPPSNSGLAITNTGVTASIIVTASDLKRANFEQLEHVTITVNIDHQRRGNVEVELDSPKGMKSILARPRRFDDATTGLPNWVFMTVKHWDEDAVGTWTLRVRDRQTNGKNGTFNSWSMQLWGSSIDAASATLWQMPVDPNEQINDPIESIIPTLPTSTLALPLSTTKIEAALPTKSIARPTEHLPEDHAEQPGEAHISFGEYRTTTAAPAPTSIPIFDEDEDEDDFLKENLGYLAGMRTLVGNPTWLFVAGGTVVVFIGAITAFFFMRKNRGLGRVGRGGGYDFAPTDEDELPMSALERGRLRMGGAPKNNNRTRDLFDAFALEESDEESDEDLGRDTKAKLPYSDSAPEGFSDGPEPPPKVIEESDDVEGDASDESAVLVDTAEESLLDDRTARERFSD